MERVEDVDPRMAAIGVIVGIESVWGNRFDEAPIEVISEWSSAKATLSTAKAELPLRHDEEFPGWVEYAAVMGVEIEA